MMSIFQSSSSQTALSNSYVSSCFLRALQKAIKNGPSFTFVLGGTKPPVSLEALDHIDPAKTLTTEFVIRISVASETVGQFTIEEGLYPKGKWLGNNNETKVGISLGELWRKFTERVNAESYSDRLKH